MSNLLHDLKTITNNSPKNNTNEDQRFESNKEQGDYEYSIKNTEPQEILKPEITYDQNQSNVPVETVNPQTNTNNEYFEEIDSGYGYTNFGQIQETSQPNSYIEQESVFPPAKDIFNDQFETQTVTPPILPAQTNLQFSQSESIFETQKEPKRTKRPNYFAELTGLIKPLLTIENLIFLTVCLLAFRIRLSFFPYISGDYGTFLKPWMEKIENEGFVAFKEAFYNYTPFYMYILGLGAALKVNSLFWVKIVSVFFDFVMAFFVAKIVQIKYPKVFKLAFMTTLMLPALIFNGSMWGQCDGIYGSFVLGSLYFLLKNDYFKSAFFFALSLCIKLQAVFFAPVFLILIITKNLPKKFILTIATLFIALYLLMIFPISQNFIFGSDARPLFDTTEIRNGVAVPVKTDGLLTIYLGQSKSYSNLVMGGVPNVYQWIANDKYEYFYQAGLGITLVAILLIAYYFVYNKITNIDNDTVVKLSLLSVLIVPFLLPKMHERYFFLVDMIAIVYSFWFPKKFWVGVVVSVVSLSVYISGVIGGNVPQFLNREFAALWILGIIIYVFYDLVKGLRQNKIEKELLQS